MKERIRSLMTFTGATLMAAPVFASPTAQLDLAATFGSLVLVIALILFLAWLIKRLQAPALGNQKGLKIVTQIPVGTKERIAVVQVGEEQFLVGITAQSIQLISKLDSPLSQEELASTPFASQLSQLLKKNDPS